LPLFLTILGEGVYADMDRKIINKGLRQRTHKVKVEGKPVSRHRMATHRLTDDMVMIQVSTPENSGTKLPSDDYCPKTEEERKRLGLTKK
jgi:sulfur carrier protein ThiS